MSLGPVVSCLGEVVAAFGCGDGVEDVGDRVADGFLGAGGGLSEPVLELGEEHLDRVEVRGVLRQQEEPGAGGADAAAGAGDGAGNGGLLLGARVFNKKMSAGRRVGTSTRST